MSYESVVIANGIDALWPLDELVADHSSVTPQLTDVSGNGRHLLCFPDEPSHPERHVHDDPSLNSPIITAPSAAVMFGRIGRIADSINRLSEFAWQAWAYNADTVAPNALIVRSSHLSSSSANYLAYGAGSDQAIGNIFVSGNPYTVSGDVTHNTWHYLVLNKLATSLQMWVDACLTMEVSVPAGPINVGTYTEFHIGSQQGLNTTIWYSRGMNYPGIGPALTEAKIIQNLEAAGYTTDCGEAEPGFRYNCPSV